jgi:hypothetical protein
MEDNKNLVEQTENVEQPTEEVAQPKTYTQEEVDAIVGKRLARQEARIRKDNDRKYGGLVEVLKAGTGKDDVGEIADTFKQYYTKKGVQFRNEPEYSDRDIEVLAKAEAQEYINAGYDDVVDEVDRLSGIGVENMTAREKAVFMVLANHRQNAERSAELSKIGVAEDVYNSDDFKEFSKKFNPNTPYREIYDLYAMKQPKKEYKTMGSMKNKESGDMGVKEFYTPEEAKRFKQKDYDNNPGLFEAVERSMLKWKK